MTQTIKLTGDAVEDGKAAPGQSPILKVEDVRVTFGGIVALDGISFEVEPNQICGIIGPNGAGKTALFNCLSRIYTPVSGKIYFNGTNIIGLPAYRMNALGIGRTFQNVALFSSMTVLDNILVGGHVRTQTGYIANFLRLPSVRREEAALKEKARELLELLNLMDVADSRVDELTFATRKRVELARALASEPEMLLLDEPAGGLSHEEVEDLRELITDIRDRLKLTILLVEHHLNLVMRVSDKVVAMNFGKKIADGTAEQVQSNPEVIRAYLGTEDGS